MKLAKAAPPGTPFASFRRMGAHIHRSRLGYLLEHCPEHPACDRNGLVMQARLVMEEKLGRFLSGQEVVHHVNRDRADNRPENLQLFPDQPSHLRHHAMEDDARILSGVAAFAADRRGTIHGAAQALGVGPAKIRGTIARNGIEWVPANLSHFSEAEARRALRGRTTLDAAAILEVTHMTLRRRFPHLIQKRQPPGFLDRHKEEIREKAKTLKLYEVASLYGVLHSTISRCLRRWSKEDGQRVAPDFRKPRGPDRQKRKRKVSRAGQP